MSTQSLGNEVQEKLTQALESGRMPAGVEVRAKQLLARLCQPVRLGVLGRFGSGKSSLVNLLVGFEVLPYDVRLPTTQVTFAEKASAVCTLADGTKREIATASAYDITELKPLFVELRLPLPALKKISVLEVVTPNNPNAIHKASQWAAKRCELAIWCTETFDVNEQEIWGQMPDILKDHAFLMLTKADQLKAKGTLEQVLDATRALAGHEFSDILPIATLEAIAARRLDGSVDKKSMRSSGGLALISAVLKQIDLGRQSDVDMAVMLLHQLAQSQAITAKVPEADNEVLQAVIGTASSKPVIPVPEVQVKPTSEPVVAASEPTHEPELQTKSEPITAAAPLEPA
jgi:hypothetical protein